MKQKNPYYQMGQNAYKNGDERWPMAHGLVIDSVEAGYFSKGYEDAARNEMETAMQLASAA